MKKYKCEEKKYKCEECRDTGFVGDQNAGKGGRNTEFFECDCTREARKKQSNQVQAGVKPENGESEEMYLNMQYYMEYCQMNGYITPHEWLDKHKHF